jgi:DNA-binding NarL/FixJ family response regulator
MPPAFRADYARTLAAARTQLDATAFATSWAAGRLLLPEHAVAAAWQAKGRDQLAAVHPESAALPIPSSPTVHVPAGDLTAREVDVLRLVATGLTNAQVAGRLVISPCTVHAHLRSIYGKLDVTTRSAATRSAIDGNLIQGAGD